VCTRLDDLLDFARAKALGFKLGIRSQRWAQANDIEGQSFNAAYRSAERMGYLYGV